MPCAASWTPPDLPVLPAGALPRAGGGAPCPVLAGAARECAPLERPAPRARALALGAKAAAAALHAGLLLLAFFLESLPAPAGLGAPLVCTLDLTALPPAASAPASSPALAAAPPAPQPAPRPAPKPRAASAPKPAASKPAPVPEAQPVSVRESAPAETPPAPASAPAPAAPPAPEASPAAAGTAAESPAAAGEGLASATPARGGGGGPGAASGVQGGGGRGFELSQVDTVPRLTRRFEPEYPYAARSRNLSGTVTVRFLVDEDGRVDELTVLSAEPAGVFEHSVLKAVRRWRFKPGERAGRPVPTWVVLPVRFNLTG
ncbi:MAG: energy transducer TonB [Thermodesulfobacteriota bacterium]